MPDPTTPKIKDLTRLGISTLTPRQNAVAPTTPHVFFHDEAIEQSLPQRFEAMVAQYPRHVAIQQGENTLSYDRLNQQANHVAHTLLAAFPRTLLKGRRAALLFDQGVERIAALLGVLKTGMVYVPLDAQYPVDRLRYMLADCDAAVIVTNPQHIPLAQTLSAGLNRPGGPVVLINSAALSHQNPANPALAIEPQAPAYILYTSGSTGQPKGVLQCHRNVLHHCRVYTNALHIHPLDRLTLFSSYSFDAAKMDIYGALLNGATLYPYDIKGAGGLPALPQWLQDEGITIYHSIPTVYRYVTDILEKEPPRTFPALRLLVLGGEAVNKRDIELYKKYFPPHALLINGLGPTESTLTLQFFMDHTTRLTREAVPVGFPVPHTQVLLRNEQQHEVGLFGVGEMVFQSDFLALGYVNNPELTAAMFSTAETGARLYHTGDLGRRLADGSIEYAGRKDFQVKIRGFRVEPGEIENRIDRYPGIKKSVVICNTDPQGENILVVYYTTPADTDPVDDMRLVQSLKESLPDYMIPSIYIWRPDFPLTPTGKIDRQGLARLPVAHLLTRTHVPPQNQTQTQLVAIWQEILKTTPIGITENFFVLGGNSLKAILLAAEIQKQMAVTVTLVDLFRLPTIQELAVFIQETSPSAYHYPQVTPDTENLYRPFPLTDIQMTYLLGRSGQFEIGGVSTHSYKEFTTHLDIQRLNRALNQVIARHPMLRAIILEEGEQQILPIGASTHYIIPVSDLSPLAPAEQEKILLQWRAQMSHHMFDTSRWPLFEIKAFKLANSTTPTRASRSVGLNPTPHDALYCFCIGEDRISMDNFSSRMVQAQIADYYNNPLLELPPLVFTFRDYMMAYKALENTPIYHADRDYWRNRLPDFPSAPSLPLKTNPADIKKPRFQKCSTLLSANEWQHLKQCASQQNITPAVLLCTVYAEVLAYWSNQTRLALNLTLYNRYPVHQDINHIAGDFTTLVILGLDFSLAPLFWDKARFVQSALFEAIQHRHYDGVSFIRDLGRYHNMGHRAVMPLVFTSLLVDAPSSQPQNQEVQPGYFSSQTSQAFIDNVVSDMSGHLTVTWNYVADLFDPLMIETMFQQYCARLGSVADDPDRLVFQLPSQDAALLAQYNHTRRDIPPVTLHGLFARQVVRHPHRVALAQVTSNHFLTYTELDHQANRVARYLMAQGVGRGNLVGLAGDREIGTIVNMLGILKTGAAYVPIDPEYPPDRIQYILTNSHCRLFLEPRLYRTPELQAHATAPVPATDYPQDIAYVIYTSGSTGRPKGVVITHQAAANTLLDIHHKFQVSCQDRFLAISSLCFDLSVYDILGALSSGAVAVLIQDQRDIPHLLATLSQQQITLWNSVPSIMDLVVERLGDPPAALPAAPEKRVFWWPVKEWPPSDSSQHKSLLPALQRLTQPGISPSALLTRFPDTPAAEIQQLVQQLLAEQVLVDSILSPRQLFDPRHQWFPQTPPAPHTPPLTPRPPSFAQPAPVSFAVLSSLLSLCQQRRQGEAIRYHYASAGGLYPIDIYLHIYPNRVTDLVAGLYFYDPVENSLFWIPAEPHLLPGPMDDAALFSLYMIYNANVTMPKYGGLGYWMAGIDAGILTGVLAQWATCLGLDSQSVGHIPQDNLPRVLHLEKNQVFLHSLEFGTPLHPPTPPAIPPLAPPLDSLDTAADTDIAASPIISPADLFNQQETYFQNPYSRAIRVIPAEYEKFKAQQLSRTQHYAVKAGEKIPLPPTDTTPIPPFIQDRRSWRTFNMSRLIPLPTLSLVLAVFRQDQGPLTGNSDYYYDQVNRPYALNLYLYTKPGAVAQLAGGLYYYEAQTHALHAVSDEEWTADFHFPGNRAIFHTSACSLFIMYNGHPHPHQEPAGALGYFKAALHCGTAVANLSRVCEENHLGLCSIGNLDFKALAPHFHLHPYQTFLHAVELGCKFPAHQHPAPDTPDSGDILSLDQQPHTAVPLQSPTNASLRLVMCSGDWIPLTLPPKVWHHFPRAQVVSLGGATEGSIWSIHYPFTHIKPTWKSIPYGFPLANQQFYVLNQHLEPCPVDVPGELYIGGQGVARGYLNDPLKTQLAFIQHPVLGYIYKTGDFGVFRRDTEPPAAPHLYIEFLGRQDNQVKIKGYRVELGEIETCLLAYPAITSAVVVDWGPSPHHKVLCAYMVPLPGLEPPTSLLRAFLAEKLPGYMIPTHFRYLPHIPLTPNGKVDRKALPAPEAKTDRSADYAPPRDHIEHTLVDICQEMFQLPQIGIHDNFFDLGATSLDILQMSKRLKEIFHITIPILKMFEYSTIRSFSSFLSREIAKTGAAVQEPEPIPRQNQETARQQTVISAKDRLRQRIQKRGQETPDETK